MIADRFEIIREIKKGRVSSTYLVKDTESNSEVALKMFARQSVPGPNSVNALVKLIDQRRSLEHNNLLKIFDSGVITDDYGFDTVFFTSEFYNGETLRERIDKLATQEFSLKEILTILKQIATTLKYLHSNNFPACNLTPSQILINERNEIKISSFGYLTTQSWNCDSGRLAHVVMPDVRYVSPESIMHGLIQNGTELSDIYLFGILAFELATGIPPFDAGSDLTLKLHQKEPLPKTLKNSNLPSWYEGFVKNCMAKNPEERLNIDSIIEFLDSKLNSSIEDINTAPIYRYSNELSVLVVEDNKLDQLSFARFTREVPLFFNYAVARSLKEARNALAKQKYDIIVSDYMLPDGTGIELISEVKPIPVIIITGAGRETVAKEALRAGAADYISKQVGRNHLQSIPEMVRRAWTKINQNEEETNKPLDTLNDLIRKSAKRTRDAKNNIDNRALLLENLQELEKLCQESEDYLNNKLAELLKNVAHLAESDKTQENDPLSASSSNLEVL